MKQKFGKLFIQCIGLLLYGLAIWPLSSTAGEWENQRTQFRAALAAREAGDQAEYARLGAALVDYPLRYYLEYQDLSERFGKGVTESELRAFLARHGRSVLGEKLRASWLYSLARDNDWQTYLEIYHPEVDNTVLHCYHAQALLNAGAPEQWAVNEARDLWLVGHSQPNKCDPVFEYLYQNDLISNEMVWQRIYLAMEEGNTRLAGFLAKRLDNADQRRVALWQAIWHSPERHLTDFNMEDNRLARRILRDGLLRLARKDPPAAHRLWPDFRKRYAFTESDRAEISREIALAAARKELPQAAAWLRALDKAHVNEAVCAARVRLAMLARDWKEMRAALELMPATDKVNYQWRYWHARALEETGQKEKAKQLFRELAKVRDYYGFLAADRVGQPYSMVNKPTPFESRDINALYQKYPGVLRAREFFLVGGMQPEARREWRYETGRMSKREQAVAAVLARQWGWFDQAIATAAQAGIYDDLEVRFPVAFSEFFHAGAESQGLDLAWVYGIVRRESAFMHDARSHAGALGMMQLMPATGRHTAQKIGLELEDTRDILDLETNIRLGTGYLRQMLDRFDGDYMLASAAYNAGPGRIKRWLKEHACLPADLWAELIPFEETREYVRRVLEYTAVFEHRLGRKVQPMRLAQFKQGDCAQQTPPPVLLASRDLESQPQPEGAKTSVSTAPLLAARPDPKPEIKVAPASEPSAKPAEPAQQRVALAPTPPLQDNPASRAPLPPKPLAERVDRQADKPRETSSPAPISRPAEPPPQPEAPPTVVASVKPAEPPPAPRPKTRPARRPEPPTPAPAKIEVREAAEPGTPIPLFGRQDLPPELARFDIAPLHLETVR